jgi:hypothetical protein
MSFFKLLSDKKEDFESEEYYEPPDSYEIQSSEMQDFLELTLDTGEMFSVPLEWLICACRSNQFGLETNSHNGCMH